MILVRHAEIYTKSEPVRRYFVARLAHNIQTALPDAGVQKKQWRIFVDWENEKKAIEKLKKIFGIASISVAKRCDADIKQIKELAEKIKVKGSFAVRAKRITKNFPMTSREINIAVAENINHKVDLVNPSTEIFVEIYDNYAYVFSDIISGAGGLPLGTAGKAVVLLENENDVLAGLMMMKRGIKPMIIGKMSLRKKLIPWSAGCTLKEVSKPRGWAVISGVTDLKEFALLQKKYTQPVFAPLIGLSDKQLKELKEKFNHE